MPEGDTVWRTAAHLHAALAGNTLTRTDFRVPDFATADLSGQRVDEVVARGKHILMRVGGHTIHTHLKMEGAWHVYSSGQRWRRPAFEARLVLETAAAQAVGFSLGVVALLDRDDEASVVGHLGPDVLGPDWDLEETVSRIASQPGTPIFSALHDQRNVAGFGNVYVNEICFVGGLLPLRPVGDVADLRRLVGRGRQMMVSNRDRVERTMTGNTRKGQMHWVFSRDGRPCRRCGTAILNDQIGVALRRRNAFWCPHCQR